MRARPLLAALAIVALSSCGGTSDSDVVGTWKLDMEKAMEVAVKSMEEALAKLPNAPPEARGQIDRMREQMRGPLAAIQVEFDIKGDGTFQGRMSAPGETQGGLKGTWKDKGATVVLTPTEIKGQPARGDESIELTKRDGNLELDNKGIRIVLTRK
jgi:hypothetical protein